MDPHTYDHKKLMMMMNTTSSSWDEISSRRILLENMASSMDDDHHQHSHIFFHDQQHHHALPTSLDHHSPVWTSACSTNDTNLYVSPFSHPNHIMSTVSLRFLGSNISTLPTNHHQHHQATLDDHQLLLGQELHQEDEQVTDKDDEAGYNNKPDLCVHVNEGELDHVTLDNDEEEEEELSAMKEMMYKIAAMQPVDIDPSTIRKPKRRNVRISDDPQSMAARHRRERISEKMRILQRLVPGGTKMDTASMLDEAIRYVKFLKRQIKHLQQDAQLLQTSSKSSSLLDTTTTPFNHHHQQLVVSHSTSIATEDHNRGTFNYALIHHHDHREIAEKPLDILNICTSSNSKVHQCMDNNSVIMQSHLEMDIFSQQVSGFMDRR